MGRQKWTDDFFGKQIKTERERRKWSQAYMARMLVHRGIEPMHSTTLAKIEIGDRSVRLNEAVAIADLFKVDLDHLLGRSKPDQSTREFALVTLSGYAGDTAKKIGQAQQRVADIHDQVLSIEDSFEVGSINELKRAAIDLDLHLDSAQRIAQRLDDAALDALLEFDNESTGGEAQ